MEIQLEVPDMTCGHCVSAITRSVQDIDPNATVQIDLPIKAVRVHSSLASEQVIAAIEEAGYSPTFKV